MIRPDDTILEVLYKMNEHMNHILEPVANILDNEEQLRLFIAAREKLPNFIENFE